MRVKSGCAEANVATKETTPSTSTRIQNAYQHARRTKRPGSASIQRPTPAHRLTSEATGETHNLTPPARAMRLARRSDFESVRKKGVYQAHELVALRATRNGLPYSRLAFIVGRRINKKATARNLIRRRMREISRAAPIADGWDILFIGRSKVNEASFSGLQDAMLNLGRRARILTPGQNTRIKGVRGSPNA